MDGCYDAGYEAVSGCAGGLRRCCEEYGWALCEGGAARWAVVAEGAGGGHLSEWAVVVFESLHRASGGCVKAGGV